MGPQQPPADALSTGAWVDEELGGVRYGLAATVVE